MTEVQVDPLIEDSWKEALQSAFQTASFKDLKRFLLEEKRRFRVYPTPSDIFRAFELTPLPQVKVVILGQDPYHGEGQAHGLSFSVPREVRFPPSLRNIFKELQDDIGVDIPKHGDLTPWAERGVLLLNATLTVRHKSPGSHQKKGWEAFTDEVIQTLSREREHVVFVLWGNYARAKRSLIDASRHLILEAPHPSPFSAHSGFFGSKPFSKANAYLEAHHYEPVDWQL